jgi:hypothetical protein
LQPGDPGFDPNVQHGLIAAASDLVPNPPDWGCIETLLSGANGTALGTGNQNTIDIMAGCTTAGIPARVCGDLVLNGYSDWYLPSKNELYKLYLNRAAIGGFSGVYWSSTQSDNSKAWSLFTVSGSQNSSDKIWSYNVRPVRSF